MRRTLAVLALGTSAVLAACSTRDAALEPVSVVDILGERFRDGQAQEAPSEPPSRAELEAEGTSILQVEIPRTGSRALLSPVAQNAGAITWLTPDNITVTTRGGLVVATRGLGDDLMSADLSQVVPALADGGTATRIHYRLDGDNRTVEARYACRVRGTGRERLDILGRQEEAIGLAESCSGAGESFVNRYWISPDGRMLRSEQWLTPGIGAITTRRLVD